MWPPASTVISSCRTSPRSDREEIKKKYLPGCVSGDIITAVAMTEPNTGSDLAGMKTTAAPDGDYVVLNGQKTFISNGLLCDLVVVAAKDTTMEDPHKAVELYVVETGTPGFEKGKKIKKVGWHSQDTAELYFNDCRIPATNRLGQKHSGFYILMEKLQQERLVCAVGAQAAAERMLDMTIDYVKERTAFGKPISKFQNTQFKIAEMATEIKLGRTFVDKLVADHMEKKNVVIEVSMAKYWVTEMACPRGGPVRAASRRIRILRGVSHCQGLAGFPGHADFCGHQRDHEGGHRQIHGALNGTGRPLSLPQPPTPLKIPPVEHRGDSF